MPNEYTHSQRTAAYRRDADMAAAGEIKVLRNIISTISERQHTDAARIKSLEDDAIELHKKISAGKGVLYGILFASGSLGLLVVDKIKALQAILK